MTYLLGAQLQEESHKFSGDGVAAAHFRKSFLSIAA